MTIGKQDSKSPNVSKRRNVGRRLVIAAAATAMALTGGSAFASPAPPSAEGETSIMLAHHQPGHGPRRRAYHPLPQPQRRVFVHPGYAPQPRRPVESFYRPRLHVALSLGATSILDDSASIASDLGTGFTFGISGGYRMSPNFSLDVGWTGDFHRPEEGPLGGGGASVHALTLDGRFFLTGWNQRLQPYLQAGVGAYWIQHDQSFETLTGGGFQVGGGFDYYLTRSVSIGGKLLYRGAEVDNAFSAPVWDEVTSAWVSMFTYSADLKFHF